MEKPTSNSVSSHKHNPKEEEGQNIKVVLRIRPLIEREQYTNAKSVLNVISKTEVVCKDKKYKFDHVFKPTSAQIDVYLSVVNPLVIDVLSGFNCTVFAYGQTGTGKTYTMTGGDRNSTTHWTNDEEAGCIPRAIANIFDEIKSRDNVVPNVRVSYLELYCEEVRDLLAKDDGKTLVIQEAKSGVVVNGLQEVSVFHAKDVYELLEQGNNRRKTASTNMNHKSSRSHTVFSIMVHMRSLSVSGEEVLRTGKLNLVDLAGSESAAKSGLTNVKESANINRSLLTLSRVIQKLAEKNVLHAPFRDSKLTRILKDSLGGRTKTFIIATVSPASTALEETVNTLEYALQARCIKNQPTKNEKVSKQQLVKQLNDEIAVLRRELDAARSGEGFFVDPENWKKLKEDVQTYSSVLVTKESIIQEKEQRLAELQAWKARKLREFDSIVADCVKMEAKMKKAKMLIKEQHINLKKEQYVSSYYEEAAKNTVSVAKIYEEANQSQVVLKKKLETQYTINSKNIELIRSKLPVVADCLKDVKMKNTMIKDFTQQEVNNSLDIIEKFFPGSANEVRQAEVSKGLISTKKLLEDYLTENIDIHKKLGEGIANLRNETTEELESAHARLDACHESNVQTATVLAQLMAKLSKRNKIIKAEASQIQSDKEVFKLAVERLNRRYDNIIQEVLVNEEIIAISQAHNNLIKGQEVHANEESIAISQAHNDLIKSQAGITKVRKKIRPNETSGVFQNLSMALSKSLDTTKTVIHEAQNFIDRAHTNHKVANEKYEQGFDVLTHSLSKITEQMKTLQTESNSKLEEANNAALHVLDYCEDSQKTGNTPRVQRIYPRKASENIVSREKLIEKFEEEYDEDSMSYTNLSILNDSEYEGPPPDDSVPSTSK